MRTQATSTTAFCVPDFESPFSQTDAAVRRWRQPEFNVMDVTHIGVGAFDIGNCLVFLIGTGGTSRLRSLTLEGASPQLTCLFGLAEKQPLEDAESLSIPAGLSSIRGALGLSMRDLAAVLTVSRPTLYSWLDGQVMPRLAALDRIHMIGRLAKYWNSISMQPAGRFVHQPLQNGYSLLALMSRDRLQQESVEAAMRSLRDLMADQTAKRKPTLAEKLRRAGAVQLSEREYQQAHHIASPTDLTDDRDQE